VTRNFRSHAGILNVASAVCTRRRVLAASTDCVLTLPLPLAL
jgi:hypothetical protein